MKSVRGHGISKHIFTSQCIQDIPTHTNYSVAESTHKSISKMHQATLNFSEMTTLKIVKRKIIISRKPFKKYFQNEIQLNKVYCFLVCQNTSIIK